MSREIVHQHQFYGRNMCAHADVAMIATAMLGRSITPLAVAADTGQNDGSLTTINELLSMLKHYGITGTYKRPADLSWWVELLSAGGIGIALIDHSVLSSTYPWAHYVVVSSIDETHVTIFNSLERIGPTRITRAQFEQCIDRPSKFVGGQNYPQQGVEIKGWEMGTGLGFNLALDYTNNTWESLLQRFEANPPVGLLLLDSFGYDNPESKAKAVGRTFDAARRLPNTIILYRLYIPNPDGSGDNHQMFLRPEAWADWHREFAGSRIFCVANNEPTNPDFQRTANWLLETAVVAKSRGIKVSLGGLSVGGYEEHQIPMLKPLLQFLADNRGRAMLSLHEYWQVDAYAEVAPNVRPPELWPAQVNPAMLWLVGRYKRIFAYCDRNGIARPDIAIDEHGPDKINNVGGGIAVCRPAWAAYGYDPDWYLAEQLKWVNRAIYTEPQIKFQAFYQLSDPDSGNWPLHNAGAFPRFMDETKKGFERMAAPTTPQPGTQQRLYMPVTGLKAGWILNVRMQPKLGATVIAQIQNGSRIKPLDEIQDDGTNVWAEIELPDGKVGWTSTNAAGKLSVEL